MKFIKASKIFICVILCFIIGTEIKTAPEKKEIPVNAVSQIVSSKEESKFIESIVSEPEVSSAASVPSKIVAVSSEPPKKSVVSKKEPEKPVGQIAVTNKKETRAVWISFLEYRSILMGKKESQFKKSIIGYFDTLVKEGFNTVIVHARSHGDAFYKSRFYPASYYFTEKRQSEYPFDPLKIMTDEAHKRGLKIEAWVNPYRGNRIKDDFAENDIFKKWLDTDKVFKMFIDDGNPDNDYYYLNPGEPEVRQYVINGIIEIVENYNIDGIHFDDYFYPTTDTAIDANSFEKYGAGRTLERFRTDCVNELVSAVYKEIKKRKNITFGISPSGNIDNCIKKYYADVRLWGSTAGYADYLAPQLYWDYGQGSLPYEKALANWRKIVTNENVKFFAGLAPYRVAESKDDFWKSGNVLSRQITDARSVKNYGGFMMFRYDFLFSDALKTELSNLKKIF